MLEFVLTKPSCDAKVLLVDVINDDNPLAFAFINPNCDVRVELMFDILSVWPLTKPSCNAKVLLVDVINDDHPLAFAFKSSAVWVAVDIGLFRSLVLSTFPKPTPASLRLVKGALKLIEFCVDSTTAYNTFSL